MYPCTSHTRSSKYPKYTYNQEQHVDGYRESGEHKKRLTEIYRNENEAKAMNITFWWHMFNTNRMMKLSKGNR